MPAKKKAAKKAPAKKAVKKVAKKPAKKAAGKFATLRKGSAAKKAKKPAKKAAAKKKAPAKKAAKKAKKGSPIRPASIKLAAKKPARPLSAAPSKPAPVKAPAQKVAQPSRPKGLTVLSPMVETIAQITTYNLAVHGKTPDGRVYSGHGSILLSNDQHTRRAQYTITFDTITYRGTALLRGSLAEKNLVIVLDYHERPFHKGMVVSIHEQDPKTGKFVGRVLYQGRQDTGEEIITLTT